MVKTKDLEWAGRTRGGTARPPRRAEGGGRAGGRRARAARVELSSIVGGLTARSRGTPAHLRQSLPPPLPASRLEGGSTPAGVGARRALGIVAAIWGRRGMVGGTAVINQALQIANPSQSNLTTHTGEGRVVKTNDLEWAGRTRGGTVWPPRRCSPGGGGRGGKGQPGFEFLEGDLRLPYQRSGHTSNFESRM